MYEQSILDAVLSENELTENETNIVSDVASSCSSIGENSYHKADNSYKIKSTINIAEPSFMLYPTCEVSM